MTRRRYILTIGIATVMLAACSEGVPDIDAAQRDASAFSVDAGNRADALGVMSQLIATDAGDAEGSVTIEFESDVALREGQVACFGDGEMQVGLAIREGSSWSGAETVPTTVACTGEPIPLSLRDDLENVNLASFRATLTSGSAAVATLALFGESTE